ncbi:hypothetical protein GCM10009759_06060 [Kitasatospora saccharophila]|uniref:Uncharacterized protein n=1 Tax=Kitasatospora saccharophila TaxID=407973 RepID=A0ABN2W9W4_9ACTN
MSRSELPEVDEAEDRPAIGAVRLEAMFDGLRRDVALKVPAPESAEVVRRGARRRQRRRAGAVAGAGVLGVTALWTVTSVLPLRSAHGVAGVPVERSALPLPKASITLTFAPSPSLPPLPTASGWVLSALDSAEPEVRALALEAERLPKVTGWYGPWSPVPSGSPSASASVLVSVTPGASGSAGAGAHPADGGQAGGGRAGSPSGASGTASGTGLDGAFADGCVPGLVATAGAERTWGETYTDGGEAGTTAYQYVLEFSTSAVARSVGDRMLSGEDCRAEGWTVGERAAGVVALGLRQSSTAAEEVAVHVSGSMVAVMAVHRSGSGVTPESGASYPFRVAAAEFQGLGAPGATGSPGPSGAPSKSP